MSINKNVIKNGNSISLDNLTVLSPTDFSDKVKNMIGSEYFLSAYFADREKQNLYAVCSNRETGLIEIVCGEIADSSFESITPDVESAHLFEREIFESTGVEPLNHPCLNPVRFPGDGKFKIGEMPFFKMDGKEIHEVGVGPVHAGVIEPGHFRFQCHGETVYNLEISLGYQHRGIEKKLLGKPSDLSRFMIETASGDSTVAHTAAYSQILESLTGTTVSPYDNIVRAIGLELERCASHIGDTGALAGDVGFLPTQSFCGRIRGDVLNITALICGNRFGRGLVVPGGIGYPVDDKLNDEIGVKVSKFLQEYLDASKLMFDNPTIIARFESIGIISQSDTRKLGLVGPPARSAGIIRDVRLDFPFGYYNFFHIPVSSYDSGSVLGRAFIRWIEVQYSVKFILELLKRLKNLEYKPLKLNFKDGATLNKNMISVSMVEGWRGEVCHAAMTDSDGNFKNYKLYDASFYNWQGLARALKNQQISDFPICNKSFNLSYCGHDL
ncbi:MAG: NADH-quinone oxidoreductase subunit C [Deltaproteobacteria bacterium]|nr:NADH-quinone oxidoreductase subunit C [Deltaproteobacteria bacterium]